MLQWDAPGVTYYSQTETNVSRQQILCLKAWGLCAFFLFVLSPCSHSVVHDFPPTSPTDEACASTWECVCLYVWSGFFSPFKESTCSVWWYCAVTLGSICMILPHNVSPFLLFLFFILPLIQCSSLLQSSPWNRPLIIVWCVSGSVVTSYKRRAGCIFSRHWAGRLNTKARFRSRAF